MPKRWCSCPGCPACASKDRRPGSHGVLYDADATKTRRCPGCQAHATAKRNARTSSAQRGYGAAHRRKRDELMARMQDGDPCALCGMPMSRGDSIDLAHSADRTGYKGLAHARCNRGHVNESGDRE